MIVGALALLLADNTLKTLVGKNKADTTWKIFPVACPQEELEPYVILGLTGADPILCKGVGGQPEDETFDVIVWDIDYERMDTIGRRIISTLNNAVGTAGPVNFKRLTFLTHRDALDERSKKMIRIITFGGSIDPMIIT